MQETGVGTGTNSAMRELGDVVGVAVLASVFIHDGGHGNPRAFIGGCTPAVWVASAYWGSVWSQRWSPADGIGVG